MFLPRLESLVGILLEHSLVVDKTSILLQKLPDRKPGHGPETLLGMSRVCKLDLGEVRQVPVS